MKMWCLQMLNNWGGGTDLPAVIRCGRTISLGLVHVNLVTYWEALWFFSLFGSLSPPNEWRD